MGRNPEGVWGWVAKKMGDVKSMGRHLANREVYNYINYCSVVKSHKLVGVSEEDCLSLESTVGLVGADSEVAQEKSPRHLRREDEPLKSESIEKQFAQSGVYDSSALILNRNLPHCRGGDVMVMLGEEKGHVGKVIEKKSGRKA